MGAIDPNPVPRSPSSLEDTPRPAVSVVIPFAGDANAARSMLEAVCRLALTEHDEVLVVDNSRQPVVRAVADGTRVAEARDYASSYYARNVGAEQTTNDWVLFMDADCVPEPDLLDRYFAPDPADEVGALAGEVLGSPAQSQLTARYARSRGHLYQRFTLDSPEGRRMAVTANLLVRRRALEDVGYFQEGVRSGGDADLSWRLADAGWQIEYRGEALVRHHHRESVPALARQAVRIGAGRAWTSRRHQDVTKPAVLRPLLRSAAGVLAWTATRRFERAAFKGLDGVWVLAEAVGSLRSNGGPGRPTAPAPGVVFLLDEFPALTETFVLGEVRALDEMGHPVRVEAASRPGRANWRDARGLDVHWWEDDGIAAKVWALAWLAVRRPRGVLRDIRDRRRWSAEEKPWPLASLAVVIRRLQARGTTHLHVHFAAAAALNALRIGRLTGIPYSVTTHAYDVFRLPANLLDKIEGAAFAAGESRYTTDYLRDLVGPGHAARLHHLAAGVDARRFARSMPYPGGRTVVAIGRLIEKKGFADLIEAAAVLRDRGAPVRVVIAGDGELRVPLQSQADALGLQDQVEFTGALPHESMRDVIHGADVFAMPCVIAADGDRDSLPNVVYEALAMEVPVVATESVGLPEVVKPEWGRLVPPNSPAALADAIAQLLDLPEQERIALGARGREFVLAERDPVRQAELLLALIERHRP